MTEPADDVVEVRPETAHPARRHRPAAIAALVLALVVLGGGITWAATRGGGSDAAGGGLACPASVLNAGSADDTGTSASVVPAKPTASGVDGRLVPAAAPTSVLLCEYGLTGGVTVGIATAPAGPAGPALGSPTAEPYTSATDNVASSVPQPGVTGIAPDAVPTVAAPASVDVPLGRSAEHAGTDDTVSSLVTALQGATVRSGDSAYISCLSYSGEFAPRYLVGLTYDDGVVWVAGPDICMGSTNGATASEFDLTGPVLAALDGSGTDVPPATASAVPASPEPGTSVPVVPPASDLPGTGSAPEPGGSGDPGSGDPDPNGDVLLTCTTGDAPTPTPSDGTPIVAFTPTAVRVCHVPVTGEAMATDQPAGVATALAATLNGLPTLEPDVACTDIGSDRWVLLFTSDAGRLTVSVDRGGCGTATDGTRTMQAGADLFTQLDALG